VLGPTIRNWVAQADAEVGKRDDVLTSAERLRKLRRENKQLKLEREILAKATAWFATQLTNAQVLGHPRLPAGARVDHPPIASTRESVKFATGTYVMEIP
jgi:hypothetical protein